MLKINEQRTRHCFSDDLKKHPVGGEGRRKVVFVCCLAICLGNTTCASTLRCESMSWPRALGWFSPGRAQCERDPGLHLLLWQVPTGCGKWRALRSGNCSSSLQQVGLVLFFDTRCWWVSHAPSDSNAVPQ